MFSDWTVFLRRNFCSSDYESAPGSSPPNEPKRVLLNPRINAAMIGVRMKTYGKSGTGWGKPQTILDDDPEETLRLDASQNWLRQ